MGVETFQAQLKILKMVDFNRNKIKYVLLGEINNFFENEINKICFLIGYRCGKSRPVYHQDV